ncbi:MAG TPA: MMPL family transporter [Thermoanaerobaculia bacterium]|nr:MMPL family transporter [Thermoanaerobaculia bacterium]
MTSAPRLSALLAAPLAAALRRPGAWLAAFAGLTVLAAALLPGLEVRVDGESLHPADHPTVVASRHDRQRFYEPEQVVLLATAGPQAPSWTSARGMARLARLHHDLERLPETDNRAVRSAFTLLVPPKPGAPLELRTYLDPLPTSETAAAAVARRLRADPLATGLFLSADGRHAAFYLPLVPRDRQALQRHEQLTELERRLPALAPPGTVLSLLGPAVAEARLGERVLADLARLVPVMVVVMALVLAFALRTPGGVLVPLVEAAAVLVWTFAAMALTGIPVTLVTTIVPVVLTALAVTDEVHLVERLQAHLAATGTADTGAAAGELADAGADPAPAGPEAAVPDRAAVRRALEAALAEVGRPIVLTSLTTAAGFLSFLVAALAPVRWFGVFVALGILLAMAFSFTLVPALVAVLPPAWFLPRRHRRPGGSALAPGHLEGWAARRPLLAAAAAGALLALLVPGIGRLAVQDSWIDNFPPHSPIARAERLANRAFWGTYRLDVVLDAPAGAEPGHFRRAPGVAAMERMREVAAGAPHVTGVVTHLLPFERLATALELPPPVSAASDHELARVAALAEAAALRIDLRWFLTPDADAARARLLVRDADYARARELSAALAERLPPALAGTGVRWHLSGDLPLAVDVVDTVVRDQLRSIGWTLVAVALLVAAAVGWSAGRGPRRAAAVLAPAVAAVAAVLGGMGWAGLPLGIATSTFAALTLGVGVDFGIHLEAAFHRRRAAGAAPRAAMALAFAHSGRALRWNTAVLAAGFLVLAVSGLAPNRHLGLLLAAGLVASWLAAVLLLPALLAGGRATGRDTGRGVAGDGQRRGRTATAW